MKRKQALIADDGQHEVIFEGGVMIAVRCPREITPEKPHRSVKWEKGMTASSFSGGRVSLVGWLESLSGDM